MDFTKAISTIASVPANLVGEAFKRLGNIAGELASKNVRHNGPDKTIKILEGVDITATNIGEGLAGEKLDRSTNKNKDTEKENP